MKRPCVTAIHIIDPLSALRGTSTGRRAVCIICSWYGPERGTMKLASDDAISHERNERDGYRPLPYPCDLCSAGRVHNCVNKGGM